jgi:hypothetical protein
MLSPVPKGEGPGAPDDLRECGGDSHQKISATPDFSSGCGV